MPSQPVILTAAKAAQEFADGTLPPTVEVEDSASQVARWLDSLQQIAHAGRLSSIQLTGGTTLLVVKAAQITSDAQALAKIAGPWKLVVKDTAADVTAALAVLETEAKAGRLSEIALTDAGTPTLTLSAARASDFADALVTLFGGDHLVVSDTAGGVAAYLDGLQKIARAGRLTLVQLTGGTSLLTVTAAQVTTDAQALARIAGPWKLVVKDTAANVNARLEELETEAKAGRLSEIALTDSGTPTLTLTAVRASDFADALVTLFGADRLVVSDTAGGVAAYLDGLQKIAHAGRLTSIQFTGSSTLVTVTVAQIAADAQALGKIAGTYKLVVKDTAQNIAAALSFLNAPANRSRIYTIGLINPNSPITLTEDALNADAGALAKLAGTYSLDVTQVLAADATSIASMAHVATISVTDTAANVQAYLAQLEVLVTTPPKGAAINGAEAYGPMAPGPPGTLTDIALTDPGVPVLTVTQSELASDAGVFGLISTPFTLDVTGVLAADVASLASNPLVQSLSVADTGANIAPNLSVLEAANTAGKIANVVVTSGVVETQDISDAAFSLYDTFTGANGILLDLSKGSFGGSLASFLQNGGVGVPVDLALKGDLDPNDMQLMAHALAAGYVGTVTVWVTTLQGISFSNFSLSDLISITNPQLLALATHSAGLPNYTTLTPVSVAQASAYYAAPISAALEQASGGYGPGTYGGVYTPDANVDDVVALGGTTGIADTAANFQSGLSALAEALGSRPMGGVPIQLTDDLPPTIGVGASSVVGDATVLNAVTSSYLLSVEGTAEQLNGLDLSSLTTPNIELAFTSLDENVTLSGVGIYDVDLAGLAIANSGATVSAYSSGGQTGKQISLTGTDGHAHTIILIGATTTSFTLYGPLDNGMTLGQGSHLTGVLAANAQTDAAYTDVTSVAVADTAANIVSDLGQLEEVFKAGKLAGVSITDPGTPVLTLSDSQLTSDAGVLGLISTPFTLDVTGVLAADVAALASDPLVQSLSVADTGANIAPNLSVLEAANTAGKIADVVVTSGVMKTPDFSDAAFSLYDTFTGAKGILLDLSKGSFGGSLASFLQNGGVGVPVDLALKGDLDPNDMQLMAHALAAGYVGTVTAWLPGLQTHLVRFSDFSLADLISITNPQLLTLATNFGGLDNYTTINPVSIAQATAYYAAPISTALETADGGYTIDEIVLGSFVTINPITDTAADLQSGLSALAAALGSRPIVAIQLTDNPPPTISVSPANVVADANVLNAVTSSYVLSVQGTAEQLNGLDLSSLTTPNIELAFTSLDENVTLSGVGIHDVNLAGLAIANSGATVGAVSNGEQISLIGTDGHAHTITLIGATPTSFTLYAPLDNGMTLGQGSHLTGVLAADAQTDAAYTDVTAVAVADTAANIVSDLGQLEEVFKAGKLAGVSITDPGTPVLTVTQSELASDAGVFGLISTPFTLDVTGVLAADVASLASNPLVQSLSVADTGANIAPNLSVLEAANTAGKIANVVVTSGVVETQDISDAAFSLYDTFTGANGILLDLSKGSFGGSLASFLQNGGVGVPVDLALKGDLDPNDMQLMAHALAAGYVGTVTVWVTTLQGISFSNFSLSDLISITNPQLLALATHSAGLPNYTTLTPVSVAQASAYYAAPISAALEQASGGYGPGTYGGVYTPDANVDDVVALGGTTGIADTAANFQSGLSALAEALGSRPMGGVPIQLTDDLPPTIGVGASSVVGDATVLNAVTSSYLLSVEGTAEQLNGLDLSSLTTPNIELAFTSLDENVTLSGVGIYDVDLAGLAIANSGATVSAYSSGGQTGEQISLTGTDGHAHTITLIGATPTSFTLYGPLDNGMTLGAHGPKVTGGDTVAQALAASGPVAVSDTAANIGANLDALAVDAANITGIGFTNPGKPTLSLTEAQTTADAAVLALLSGSYSLAVTSAVAADAEGLADNTDIGSVAVADTGANIVSDLGQLEEVFKAGKLGGVSITSGTLGTLSSSELFADADVIRLISNTPSGSADVAAATLWMRKSALSATGSATAPSHASTEHRFIAAMAGLGVAAANSTAFGEIWTMPPGILAVAHLASLS